MLQKLQKSFSFILIGGWAVWLYTHCLKSKDIDLVIEYDVLEKLRNDFDVRKNDRLKKYEIGAEEVDIDLYLPFYSNPGIPAEDIKQHTRSIEGFTVPSPEMLLILKETAMISRLGSSKGEKDSLDLWSLMKADIIDWQTYQLLLRTYQKEALLDDLTRLLAQTTTLETLGLNQNKTAKLKKQIRRAFEALQSR